jgi:hypothetical protein
MIKTFTFLNTLMLVIFLTGVIPAQPIFTEDFETGTADPNWESFFSTEEIVTAVPMANAPQPLANGGSYVGFLQDADGSYTGAALSVIGETTTQNYSVEGDVYCYVNHPAGSAYTGLAFYCDSTIGTYIKLVADFDSDQRLRLYNNRLDPITFQYSFSHNFTASDVPGGIPTADGWHHMKIEVKTLNADTTAFWCYFDDQMLLGSPIYDTSDDRMAAGQIGLFSFSQGTGTGLEGYFDNLVVNSLVSAVNDNLSGIPDGFSLGQNYPNPFNPETQIAYQLASGGFVSLNIYDLLGREVKSLVSEDQTAGSYNVTWNGTDNLGIKVPSGVYLYTLNAGNFVVSKKMILMK